MKKIFAVLAAITVSIGASAQLSYITGLYKDKTATANPDGSYTLTLDTWCNGTTIVEEKTTSKNANVALVIDKSTSMCVESNATRGNLIGYVQADGTVNSKSDGKGTTITVDKTIYYSLHRGLIIDGSDGNGQQYLIVRWSESDGCWQLYGNQDENGSTTDTVGWHKLKAGTDIWMCGYAAVCTAVQRLVDNLKNDAETCGATHQITLYSFCKDPYKELDTWTLVTTGYETIMNTLFGIALAGSTNSSGALEYAVTKVEKATASTTANIVFFTDGVNSDANTSISKVKTAKTDNGVKVFSIGYFFDTTTMNNAKAFLERVSSNYLDATTQTDGTRTDSCYFKTTNDPMDLIHYFDIVSLQIAKEAKTYNLDKYTQVRDTLTSEFILPTTESSQLSIYTIDCTGLDADGNPTFDGIQDTITVPMNITIGSDKKSVEVHGFDFGANYCGRHYNQSTGAITIYGKKLRIQFKINTTDQFRGGIDINTNTMYSGIYPTGSTTPATKFVSPQVAGPIDLIVTSSGLTGEHENMIFRITRTADGASSYDTSWGQNGIYEMILTGTADADTIKSCSIKVNDDNNEKIYKYTVETQAIGRDNRWDWHYDSDANKRKQTKPIFDTINAKVDNVFPFVRVQIPGLPTTAEDVNTQIIP